MSFSTKDFVFENEKQIQRRKNMFNKGKEKKKFDLKWKKLRNEYEKVGMSDNDILQMYEFDLAEFNSTRKYYRYLENILEDSMLKRKVSRSIEEEIVCDIENNTWIELISDEKLYRELKKLKKEELEILIMYIVQGYNQREIAQKVGCSRKSIWEKLLKIKKFEK